MELRLVISPEDEVKLLETAKARGLSAEQIASEWFHSTAKNVQTHADRVAAGQRLGELFREMEAEAAAMTPKEREAEGKSWLEFARNFNETRRLEGRPPAFPWIEPST